jgi:DNA-3-methyladenine glycosylase I
MARGTREIPNMPTTNPRKRCAWADTNELFIPYHDEEWGTPQHDDQHLFEMLNLEGAQAGLSWLTILKKREAYRKAFLAVQREFGSFDTYIWSFVEGKTISHAKRDQALAVSERLSKELKKRDFTFVGATICFAFMQAIGMVDDHVPNCFRSGKRAMVK